MGEKQKFDVAVIGAGPGGYVAAIKASQMGRKVALIEKQSLGGTCLNVGCIPSKTLLSNAQLFKKFKRASDFGIEVDRLSFNYQKMKERKDRVVEQIRNSLGGLLRSNGIAIFNGHAAFLSPNELKVRGVDNALIRAEKIIIATGSQPIDIPAFPCDHQLIHNSTSIFELTELPKSMCIIGGGYIGCEFASLFSELGVEITIIEAMSSIVAMQGNIISQHLSKAFTKQGITIKTNVSVKKIDKKKEGIVIHLSGGDLLESDMALVAVGRKLNVEGLGLEKAGLKTNAKGAIEVNEKLETTVSGIYAIGDITAIHMLAHVASHQGIVAAANACSQDARMHYRAVPAVIFTNPEIATVGLTKEQAIEESYEITVGNFPFQALGKTIATGETEGFAQVISDKQTGEILGAQVIGHEASNLIAEMALAINNELTLDCIMDTIHAHPTMAEGWLEASLLANETPIHFPPKIKKQSS